MCATKEVLEVFSMWYDYIYFDWGNMVQLTPFNTGNTGFFWKVTETVYCTQGAVL